MFDTDPINCETHMDQRRGRSACGGFAMKETHPENPSLNGIPYFAEGELRWPSAFGGQTTRRQPVIKTKTGLISQGVTKKPGEFSNWYISRIS